MTPKPQPSPITITPPLPGWVRLRHVRSGSVRDLDSTNETHQILLAFYRNSPDWEEISPANT